MDVEDTLENPAFWILAGLMVVAEIIGFIWSNRSENLPAFPVWQFLVLVLGTIVIAAVFASRD